jgi:hypothetical protein
MRARLLQVTPPGARCAVAGAAEGLVRTMLRLYAERGIHITSNISLEHTVRAQHEDVEEMLGKPSRQRL